MMATCAGCGAFLQPDWDRCRICGSTAGAAPPPAPAPVHTGPAGPGFVERYGRIGNWVLAVGAVAFLVVVVSAIASRYHLSFAYVLGYAFPSGVIGGLIGIMKRRVLLGFVLGACLGCVGWLIIFWFPVAEPRGRLRGAARTW